MCFVLSVLCVLCVSERFRSLTLLSSTFSGKLEAAPLAVKTVVGTRWVSGLASKELLRGRKRQATWRL